MSETRNGQPAEIREPVPSGASDSSAAYLLAVARGQSQHYAFELRYESGIVFNENGKLIFDQTRLREAP